MRFDVVVIGSGFGGSVAALRLAEKGYSVAVLEAGRRFEDKDFPKTSWRVRKFLWAPALGCYGIQRIYLLRSLSKDGSVLVLSGAGVGGGSLVYANTLYRPLQDFYDDPQWKDIADWRAELAPHYDTAERMLGVTTYDRITPMDEAMRKVAVRMGVGETFHSTPVGVFLGTPGVRTEDPYFGGEGPARNGCLHCGECMTGCRHNAKNTLMKNYLYLAEKLGVKIFPRTEVTLVKPSGNGYLVQAKKTSFEADQVVFAAGALGTQRLLHKMKAAGVLPKLSDRVGALTRTNSESLVGATVLPRAARKRGLNFTEGVAITSSFHPDERTHIEPVRYGKGSNSMGLLQSALTDGGKGRFGRWLKAMFSWPFAYLRAMSVRGWSERTIIALVMQSHNNSLNVHYKRGKLRSTQGIGAPNPTWIPEGNTAVRLLAEEIGGVPGGSLTEMADIPITAHILGGAVIGKDPDSGVVDQYHRVFGYRGLHVVDGAAVSANLGVNPSLTITAQAERAFSHWPRKGEPDPRPDPMFT
ncbi:MAG TPA: cholesterol oxidase [Micromonosporaceae bacterium]|nr:cholesterol oxidase [Micromonosporaceae bacterium]HCU50487.1 cholesterol oxidase [Micromonosporaceae bacterium]